MAIAQTLQTCLDNHGVDYEVIEHRHSSTSSETASKSHIPAELLAKAVLLEDDRGCLMAVIPSSNKVDLGIMHKRLNRHVGLATEPRVAEVFSDCDPGAIPPIGTAYGLLTLVDDRLFDEEDIYMEAGDHEELIHLSSAAFRELLDDVQIGHISSHR